MPDSQYDFATLTDPTALFRRSRQDILSAIETACLSEAPVDGPIVTDLEQQLVRVCGVGHVAATDNATNALVLGLRALGVQPEDEVVTTADAGPRVAVAIQQLGARAVFVDIDPDTGLIDPERLRLRLGRDTTCVVAVHRHGHPAPMDRLVRIAGDRGIPVLEDATDALGATGPAGAVGTLGHAAALSLEPDGVMGGVARAGAVITDDGETDRRVRSLRSFGRERGRDIVDPGYDARLDAIPAAIVSRLLPGLAGVLAARRRSAARYAAGLADVPGLRLPTAAPGTDPAWPRYVVRAAAPERLLKRLVEQGVTLPDRRGRPLHLMPGFMHLGLRAGDLPATEAAMAEAIHLPTDPDLTEAAQDGLILALRAAAAG